MTAVSVPSTSFRFGYALGTLTREFVRSMKRTVGADGKLTHPAD